MADSRVQAYVQKLDELVRNARKLSPEAERIIQKLLEDASREITADLAGSDPTSYNAARLRSLKAEVDRTMADFARAATSQINALQATAYRTTALNVDATVEAAMGGVFVHPVIEQKALAIVQGYTADLIGGLSSQGSAQITSAIQRAYLGQSDLSTLIDQVGRAREGSAWTGITGQTGRKAMDVATNEVMRVNSLASEARINDLATRHPDLLKRWRHIPAARVPRVSHILADGQTVKPGESFLVGGELLKYPRDPNGRPDNTINCDCLQEPAFAPESLKPTDEERKMLDSLGLSVTTAAA